MLCPVAVRHRAGGAAGASALATRVVVTTVITVVVVVVVVVPFRNGFKRCRASGVTRCGNGCRFDGAGRRHGSADVAR